MRWCNLSKETSCRTERRAQKQKQMTDLKERYRDCEESESESETLSLKFYLSLNTSHTNLAHLPTPATVHYAFQAWPRDTRLLSRAGARCHRSLVTTAGRDLAGAQQELRRLQYKLWRRDGELLGFRSELRYRKRHLRVMEREWDEM